uniref:Uncharacterized protein n=1 Tax=Panagrolaimus sp. PS1159 TaxID=55785 RepID=A0AC35FL22_9BILA
MSSKRVVLLAKDRCLSSKSNQLYGNNNAPKGLKNNEQFESINLNQNQKFKDIKLLQSKSISFSNKNQNYNGFDDYKIDTKSALKDWKKNDTSKLNGNFKNQGMKKKYKWHNKAEEDCNKSTLSLHTGIYENMVETKNDTSFDFLSQQNEGLTKMEIMHFKTSQKLLNFNAIERNDKMSIKYAGTQLLRSVMVQKSILRGLSTASSDSTTSEKPPLLVERLSKKHEGIVQIRMNRPQTKNAISKAMLETFCKAVEELKFDKSARVLIIRSDVPGAFCTGADLKERRTMPAEEVPKFVDRIRQLTSNLASLPIPVIAAIDGYALGGGLEIALACDILIATKDAKMGLTETKLAIIPGAGGTQRLSRAVGVSKAKELIFTAKMIDGIEAERIGLVSRAVDDKSSVPYAFEMAELILKNGPIATKLAKTAVDVGSQTDLANGLIVEQQCYAQVIPTQDRLEALKAFNEKRAPVFKGE